MESLLQRIASALGRVNAPLARAGRSVAALLLAAMLGLALAQVLSRGLFDHSLDWAEELARVALVWSVLLVAPQAYRSGAHVAIVSFADALPRRLLEITASTMDLKMAWIYAVVPFAFAALLLVALELLARLLLEVMGARSGIVMEGAMPAVVED